MAAHLLSDKDGTKVENIEKSYRHIEGCRTAMIREYFKSGEVSWDKVLEALEKAGEQNTADKIKSLLLTV